MRRNDAAWSQRNISRSSYTVFVIPVPEVREQEEGSSISKNLENVARSE